MRTARLQKRKEWFLSAASRADAREREFLRERSRSWGGSRGSSSWGSYGSGSYEHGSGSYGSGSYGSDGGYGSGSYGSGTYGSASYGSGSYGSTGSNEHGSYGSGRAWGDTTTAPVTGPDGWGSNYNSHRSSNGWPDRRTTSGWTRSSNGWWERESPSHDQVAEEERSHDPVEDRGGSSSGGEKDTPKKWYDPRDSEDGGRQWWEEEPDHGSSRPASTEEHSAKTKTAEKGPLLNVEIVRSSRTKTMCYQYGRLLGTALGKACRYLRENCYTHEGRSRSFLSWTACRLWTATAFVLDIFGKAMSFADEKVRRSGPGRRNDPLSRGVCLLWAVLRAIIWNVLFLAEAVPNLFKTGFRVEF